MQFASAETLLLWIIRNWHYVPGDPLAKIIQDFLAAQMYGQSFDLQAQNERGEACAAGS